MGWCFRLRVTCGLGPRLRVLLCPVLLADPSLPAPASGRAAACLRTTWERRDLSYNFLEGNIPTEVGGLTSLTSL